MLYTGVSAYADGSLLAEEASVRIARKSGLLPQYTEHKGFAGMSQGAAHIEITIESAVPSTDFEMNPGPYMIKGVEREFTFAVAGRTLTTKGFITDDNFSKAVNQEAKLEFTVMAAWADWE